MGYKSHITSPFPSKMRAGFAENGEVGLDNYPRFPLFFGRFVLEILVHILSQNDQWHVVIRASRLTGL